MTRGWRRWISRFVGAGVVTATVCAGCGTRAEPVVVPPEIAAVVSLRASQFREIGTAFKALTDEMQSGDPYLPSMRRSALQIRDLSRDLSSWFPTGSGPETGLDTKARAEIWKRPEDFARATSLFQTRAEEFAHTVESGDLARISAHLKALGDSCAGCHDVFRVEDD